MSQLKSIETRLENIFVKNAPKMSADFKKALVNWLPWLTVIGAIIMAWGILGYWRLFNYAEDIRRTANEIARLHGGGQVYPGIGTLDWLWIIVALAQVVFWFAAVSGLKNRQRKGWLMLFYGELVGVVAVVLSLFRGYGAGSAFFGGLIGLIIGFYLLFQVRSYYTDGKSS